MPDLPSGTVTFLFTDIEGSTARWERDQVAMATAVARHLTRLRAATEGHDSALFKTVVDGAQVAFPTTSDTVVAPTAHPRCAPLSWPYRACPRRGSILVRRHSAGHPRGVLRRGPVPHQPSVAAARRATRRHAA